MRLWDAAPDDERLERWVASGNDVIAEWEDANRAEAVAAEADEADEVKATEPSR